MAWQDQGRKENGEFDSGTAGFKARQITGGASYYNLPGNNMANGKSFNANEMNAAMLNVPLGTKVRVLSLETSRSIEVTVTDRGPYVSGRIIDLTPRAFEALFGSVKRGTGKVVVAIPSNLATP